MKLKTLLNNSALFALASLTLVACGDGSTGNTNSMSERGKAELPTEKTMSALSIAEQANFSEIVVDRISPILFNETFLTNMCSLTGAVAGMSSLPSDAQSVCEDTRGGCQQGVDALIENTEKLRRAAENMRVPNAVFACNVNVDKVLGCLEESARVMEAIEEIGQQANCIDPQGSVENILNRMRRINPNREACEDMQRACPARGEIANPETQADIRVSVTVDNSTHSGSAQEDTGFGHSSFEGDDDFDDSFDNDSADDFDDSADDFDDDFDDDFEDDFDF